MNDITTVRLRIGLGDLSFGATREAVAAYLGEPESTEQSGPPGDSSVMWYYHKHPLKGSASFDEESGFTLSEMMTSAPSASLNGHCLMGRPKAEVLERLSGVELGECEENVEDLEDDDDQRVCELWFHSVGLGLHFEDDMLDTIQWGFPIEDDA